ncbi:MULTISPECIES: hypothetical protein [unclassified Oceanobacillus]|uniref:hypothetical protein n=1 Tax=unclassified Oceanobacillus TaxID=2630292 RepID=UPI00300DCD71
MIFIYYLTKIVVVGAFITLVVFIAFLWDYIAGKLEKNRVKIKAGKMITVLITMIVQLLLVLTITVIYHLTFIDTLFVTCFLILCITWIFSYFGNYSQNNQRISDKYQGGSDYRVKVFQLRLNPVLLGVYLFSIIGILFGFLYYAHYFI